MSGLLTSMLYWLAWLFFRPLNKLIQYKVTRADLRAELQLDPNKPVVYILPTRSWADLFVLERICKDLALPPPSRTGLNFPTPEVAGVVYLPAVLETRIHPTELSALLEGAVNTPSYDAQLIPVTLFWGRDPGKETSLFKLAFFDSPQASAIRKLFIIFANGRNVFANFGLPLQFREYVDKEKDAPTAIRKLTRVMHFHFLRARTAALGPTLLRRGVVVSTLLQTKTVQQAIQASIGGKKNYTPEQSLRYARKCAEEICADYSTLSLTFIERFLGTFVWHRVFKGIDVQGLEKMRQLATTHEIVYMPCHRSHADYLLVSYSLYHAGLVPPHIAAGINLNIPLVGPLLRRCGAFFMRRSFSGDKIYTAVFRAYVESLIQRGYPIEFFPEGGRSRTGRLLSPKMGLLNMVVEAGLRQRTRKVALVPVFIGYDKAWELNSYSKELRGGAKQKESVQGLLKASKILGKSFGKAYINFGEPLDLQTYADTHLPNWREQTQFSDDPITGLKPFVARLAAEHMRRINDAAVANPVSLAAVAMLSSPQRAVSEEELVEQIGHLIWLLKGQNYSALQYIPENAPRAVVDWSAPIAGIRRAPHPWGDLMALADREAVLLTYNRNNIQHLFALPSLIANFFRTRGMLPEEAAVMGCRALYPFLRTEFFLRWDNSECETATRECIEVMVKLGLLTRTIGGDLRRPDVTTPAFSTLSMLGRVMSETLERYCMTALLLAEESKTEQPLRRDKFEEDCRLLAERMAILTGRDAPEFFDKALFRGHMTTLIEVGLVVETDAKTLAVDPKIERVAERSMELLSDEARQTLLQLLSRRRTPAATATEASV